MTVRPNMQEFSTIAGLILDQVFEEHPIRVQVSSSRVMELMKVDSPTQKMESGRMFKEMFGGTLKWLVLEGFVDHGIGDQFCLTTKALAAMNAMPANLGGRSIGDAIAEAKSEGDAGERRSRIAAIVGDFIGSAAGSFTKSIGTGG